MDNPVWGCPCITRNGHGPLRGPCHPWGNKIASGGGCTSNRLESPRGRFQGVASQPFFQPHFFLQRIARCRSASCLTKSHSASSSDSAIPISRANLRLTASDWAAIRASQCRSVSGFISMISAAFLTDIPFANSFSAEITFSSEVRSP